MTTETNRTEFKRKLTDKFERSVVAFLNYPGGGEILVGVDNDGSIVGVDHVDQVQLQIVDRIKNNIRPAVLGLFDVAHEQRDGKDVIRVVVSAGQQRPYYLRARGMTEDGCFIRVGSSSQPMTEHIIEGLLSKRQSPSLQTMRSPRQSLTFRQLKIYYEERHLSPNDAFLKTLDLVDDSGAFNYAAYLLADDNGVSIKVAKYAGTDKYDLAENEEYGNRCLLTAAHRVLERLESENRTFAKIGYPTRIEKDMVDKTALREAVINAIVHNDYNLTTPLVEIFSDRIVVTSAGGLVSGLSQEDFFNCRSMPRNRTLMRVFRDVELVEGLGSGMTRILRAYDRSIFELTPSFLVVTFPLLAIDADSGESAGDGGQVTTPITTSKTTQKTTSITTQKTTPPKNLKTPEKHQKRTPDATPTTTQKTTSIATQKTTPITTPKNRRKNSQQTVWKTVVILERIRHTPSVSMGQLAKEVGITEDGIKWYISKLKTKGRIRRVGSDKGGRWEVIENQP
ncbi:MAG: putative DNA binding domain-containing protein [Verrucomicrobiota bacterium]|jgi:predicted HTH transcriptional regulator|nr:putative DNA binding domain-containing protein [Verrucomicrobiota bacterium]